MSNPFPPHYKQHALWNRDHAMCLAREQELYAALLKLSNEVLGSLPLMGPLCRREFGNTNYAILIQRAEEARKLLSVRGAKAMIDQRVGPDTSVVSPNRKCDSSDGGQL